MNDSSTDFDAIPILDISAFTNGDAQQRALIAAKLDNYLQQVGFLYIKGHDVPTTSIEATREANKAFHQLPLEKKTTLKLNRDFRGYIPINTSTIVTSSVAEVSKPNQSASLMLMHEVANDDPAALAGKPLQGPNQWPDEDWIPGFRATIESYVDRMSCLAQQMLQAIQLALALPDGELEAYFIKPTTFLRLLHYPTRAPEQGLYGSAPHTDYGFITLLTQDDVGGLEVRNKNGDWIAVPPLENTFVMNVGDMLARWSNDRYVSTAHRVINHSARERYSQPFFYDPHMDSVIEALPSCVEDGGNPKYPPMVYADYLMTRIDKNYQSCQPQ